ncbi:unnamed protein product [Tilletia caries]|nr:unnamed protein product [Tilletia caries]
MFHLGALPTVIRVASLYRIFRTASAAGSDPAGEPSRGYDPDMVRAIDAWRANAGVSAADPVPHSPPAQPSSSTGPSRITRRVLQPKQIAVKPSPLRPQCAGARRFETWTPPASAPRSSSLPTDLEKQTRAVAVAGLADSTKEKYSTALASWHAYCDRYHVSEHRRTPAEQCLVEHWIASEAGSQSGKYISNKVSGLKAWHAVNNVPWTLDEARLRLIKRGAVACKVDVEEASAQVSNNQGQLAMIEARQGSASCLTLDVEQRGGELLNLKPSRLHSAGTKGKLSRAFLDASAPIP